METGINMENDYGMAYYGNVLLAKLLWNQWNYNHSGKIITIFNSQ
jgi:hypothetical protein